MNKVSDWNALCNDAVPSWCYCTAYDRAQVGCECDPSGREDCDGRDSRLADWWNEFNRNGEYKCDIVYKDSSEIPF